MKKMHLTMVLIALLSCAAMISAQEEDPVNETLAVVNVEVPVRVYVDGRTVTDLKKEDFTITEDGKPQAINGFQRITKKVARISESASGDALPASRYFVLAFRVFDFNDALQDGLNYVFNEILSPQDRLLVLVNEKVRNYPDLADREHIRAEIEGDLRDQCHRARKILQANTKEFDEWIRNTETVWEMEAMWASRPAFIRDFLQKYLDMMLLFKKRFLTQDIDQYYHFAEHLEKVRKEKWVLNFYQQEILPRMNPNQNMMSIVRAEISECEESLYSEYQAFAVLLKQLLQRIETESKTGIEFPVDQVSKLFMKVNATFHTIFIPSHMDADSQNLELRQIGSGMESNLRDLTEKTGGKLIASADLVSSLGTIVETEDSYYMLTYSPDNPSRIGKIKVKTPDKRHELRYDDNLRADYIRAYLGKKEKENPNVKVTGLALNEKKLSLTLKDFSLAKVKNETCGWLKVHIIVQDSGKKVFFNQEKAFKVGSPTFSLSLDFSFLEPGRYDVIVEVLDQVSNKTATEFIQPLVR